MGLHGWIRTGARLTARAHAVKLVRNSGESRAHSTVTIDWPVEHWLYAAVHEYTAPNDGWWWEIRNGSGRRSAVGNAKKEAGARRAVKLRLDKLTEEIRKRPAIAELEAARVNPLLEKGYIYEGDGEAAAELAAQVLKGPLEGLAAMRAGARKAGLIP